jgi:hypothetical protein
MERGQHDGLVNHGVNPLGLLGGVLEGALGKALNDIHAASAHEDRAGAERRHQEYLAENGKRGEGAVASPDETALVLTDVIDLPVPGPAEVLHFEGRFERFGLGDRWRLAGVGVRREPVLNMANRGDLLADGQLGLVEPLIVARLERLPLGVDIIMVLDFKGAKILEPLERVPTGPGLTRLYNVGPHLIRRSVYCDAPVIADLRFVRIEPVIAVHNTLLLFFGHLHT